MKCVLEERIRFAEDDEVCADDALVVRICAFKDRKKYASFEYLDEYLPKNPHDINYCKADSLFDCTAGSLNVPVKNNLCERKLAYIAMKNELIFLDDDDYAQRIITKIAQQKVFKEPSIEVFIYAFLEMMIYSDIIYLQELEDKITKLENLAIAGSIEEFEKKLSILRKELFGFYRYYSQLIDVGQEFIENENGLYDPERLSVLKLVIDRIDRLRNETAILRENLKYVREIYQSAINKKQNDTMNFLTGITTIFLPLSFIAGWYGMNFIHMPELKWAISYPIVLAVCIVVASVVIHWLKKNKFLKTRKKNDR